MSASPTDQKYKIQVFSKKHIDKTEIISIIKMQLAVPNQKSTAFNKTFS